MSEANLFWNKVINTENWSATGMTVLWGEENAAGQQQQGGGTSFPLVMLRVNAQYERPISELYPINTNAAGNMTKVNISAMPKGTLTVQSILSPCMADVINFLKKAGDPCGKPIWMRLCPFDVCDDTMTCATGTSKNNLTYDLTGVTLQRSDIDIQGGQQGQVAVVNNTLIFLFTGMKISQGQTQVGGGRQ